MNNFTKEEFGAYVKMLENFENKSLDELKEMRERFNLKQVSYANIDFAYLCRMIDFLLEKVERLEKNE